VNSPAIPLWKKRFVVLWYDFIRSELVYNEIRPIITRSDDSILTNQQMIDKILDCAKRYGLPNECWNAVVRYYSTPTPALIEVVDQIEPIVICHESDKTIINASPLTTKEELSEFIRIKYKTKKPEGKQRVNARASVRRSLIISRRLNDGLSYKQIADYLLDNGIDIEEPNIRTIVSEHKKSIK